jgi:hypothetical protein
MGVPICQRCASALGSSAVICRHLSATRTLPLLLLLRGSHHQVGTGLQHCLRLRTSSPHRRSGLQQTLMGTEIRLLMLCLPRCSKLRFSSKFPWRPDGNAAAPLADAGCEHAAALAQFRSQQFKLTAQLLHALPPLLNRPACSRVHLLLLADPDESVLTSVPATAEDQSQRDPAVGPALPVLLPKRLVRSARACGVCRLRSVSAQPPAPFQIHARSLLSLLLLLLLLFWRRCQP